MSTDSPGKARVAGLVALGLVWGLGAGCKRSSPPPGPLASQSPPAVSAPLALNDVEGEAVPARCQALAGYSMRLDPPPSAGAGRADAAQGADGGGGDDDALLPFGVDLGAAATLDWGFAVGGIGGAGQAFVALVAERSSRRVELGQLHGDAETPAISGVGDGVFVAFRSSDAAGFTLKLARVSGFDGALEWGYELSKLGKFVTDVELAVTRDRGVVAFQSEDKAGPRLMLGAFSPKALAEPFQVKPLDVTGGESPRLLNRAGGFWLSWVRILNDAKKTQKGRDAGAVADPEEAELLDVGSRVVEVAKLDEQGKLVGAPLRLGEPRRQVLLYDVAPLASGGLLVATRSDSAAPGAEGGALLLTEVGADGSVTQSRIDDDELGAGAPALLVDAQPNAPGPWLSMGAVNDATRLGIIKGAQTTLQADGSLGRGQVLAVASGRLLVQRARGRSVSLEVLDCHALAEDGAKK